MNATISKILDKVAGIQAPPGGAYNIRVDGASIGRSSTAAIEIRPKTDKNGIEIHVKPFTKGETVYIPVVVQESGLKDVVYNDFFISEGCDILIVAGCGIHNDGDDAAQHDGVHTFYIGRDARVKYVEKHYGEGGGSGERIFNPVTEVYLEPGSYMEMETVQIEGVSSTYRLTKGKLRDESSLVVKEKLMTSGSQIARTDFEIDMDGRDCSANIVSRSVAKGESTQAFYSRINGNNACAGHSECDAIIMDSASVKAVPEITANHLDASLIHEAAIGKIAGEQITKLMTLGLSEEQAEQEIVKGFLL